MPDDRTAKAKQEIRERLRKVCAHLDEATFENLVDKIAATEERDHYRNTSIRVDPAELLPLQ